VYNELPIQSSSLFLTFVDFANLGATINEGTHDLYIVAQDSNMDVGAPKDLDPPIVSLSHVS
jgi:hypothetical protein